MAWQMIALVVAASAVVAQLPPSCDRRVYCNSTLLHQVQLKEVYTDSKTFVDLRLLSSEDEVLAAFDVLLNNTGGDPTREQLTEFVNQHFVDGGELEEWSPPDFNDDPAFLNNIKDDTFRQFGRDVNDIWKRLGRKVNATVFENPELYSLIPLPNGFVVPGGRFKEIYYWDSYWIIEGLLICGMKDTARGMIENLLELVRKLGHIPNGSRVYYNERSQPPLLTAMVRLYVEATGDLRWLRNNIGMIESELQYWLQRQTISVGHHTLLRYNAPSDGPRPESYREDYNWAQKTFTTEKERREFYIDVKSAAESGWDFSSRWFVDANGGNGGDLGNVRTRSIVPVDLNAIFAGALGTLGDFHARLGNRLSAKKWWLLAARWRFAIDRVLWSNTDGVWFDWDAELGRHRKYFYPTNVSPLWAGAVDPALVRLKAPQVVRYLTESSGLSFPGGVPASLDNTGEQWDFPNAWPPLESIVIGALNATGHPQATKLALHLANVWVRSNYVAFNTTHHMYEKYDATNPGVAGGGGEYGVQDGFGWSNGVVIELLHKYGSKLTLTDNASDSLQDSPAGRTAGRSADNPSDSAYNSYSSGESSAYESSPEDLSIES